MEDKLGNYFKVNEFFLPNYEAAVSMADELFAPYLEQRSKQNERTAAAAKVRIRRVKDKQIKAAFRVVFYKQTPVEQKKVEPAAVTPEHKQELTDKHQRRHRRDRKGR